MNEIDQFSNQLLEEAKRFLEKASLAGTGCSDSGAYARASLLLGFSALEAHLNAVAEELALRPSLGVLDRSILMECDFSLDDGRFEVKQRLKMYRLEDRLLYIVANFSPSGSQSPTTSAWWPKLKAATDLRNQLVHPKAGVQIHPAAVASALTAILECLDTVYQAVFSRPFPPSKRGLQSTLSF